MKYSLLSCGHIQNVFFPDLNGLTQVTCIVRKIDFNYYLILPHYLFPLCKIDISRKCKKLLNTLVTNIVTANWNSGKLVILHHRKKVF